MTIIALGSRERSLAPHQELVFRIKHMQHRGSERAGVMIRAADRFAWRQQDVIIRGEPQSRPKVIISSSIHAREINAWPDEMAPLDRHAALDHRAAHRVG